MLVMPTLSLPLRKAKRGEERQLRFDVGKLRNPNVQNALKTKVKNCLSILQDGQYRQLEW